MSNTAHASLVVESQDVEIHCRKFGTPGATPVIIVHGLSFFSYDWIEVAEQLAKGREVIAMDMRGFGDSTSSAARDYSLQSMARDVIAVADAMGWQRVIAVGHSMGGRTCTYAASIFPKRIAGLLLVDYSPQNSAIGAQRVTETVGRQPDVFSSLEEVVRYFDGADTAASPARMARFQAYTRQTPQGFEVKRDLHFRNQFRKILETGEKAGPGVDMWDVLGQVQCPILVVRGRQSDMFGADNVPRMLAANPRLQLVEIDAGHDVVGDNAPQLVVHAKDFLARMDAGAFGVLRGANMRGIDHLALVTDDMKATMDFYTRVLRMQLVHVRRVPFERDRGQPPYENLRHYFFDMGNDSLLAFFEYPRGLPRQDRDHVGGMQHLAFSVDRPRFDALIAHIRACGVNVIGPVALGGRFWSAYFYDNNGIRLELATSLDADESGIVESVVQARDEARAELETLFDDAGEVGKWLAQMPLRDSAERSA